MLSRFQPRLRIVLVSVLALVTILGLALAHVLSHPTSALSEKVGQPFCKQNATLCAETLEPWDYAGQYTGHDEPSVLFYSNVAGSGNSNFYKLKVPTDPPTQPVQDGSGGTFHFQLHPAFWFGMALCDDQSAPNPGGSGLAGSQNFCTPDSDTNIFDGTQVADPDYIGKHPGTAFMELQFYPPSWAPWPAGNSCDGLQWCAAMAIFSFNRNQNTGANNNSACLSSVGIEPANFAFITTNGVPIGPPDPINATLGTFTPTAPTVLKVNSGDAVTIDLRDTLGGLKITLNDTSTGQSGSMTASIANGFAAVNFAPSASSCSETPFAFHPIYSTSSEHTRVPWAAHSYNVAFSDEIGHFEYCSGADPVTGTCHGQSMGGPPDGDDVFCFSPTQSTNIPVGGCTGTDVDFNGVPYQPVWPGTLSNPSQDAQVHPTSFLFTSPKFNNGTTNYNRIAFEADLPRIEIPSLSPNNNCDRSTGAGCVNPPNGANFYPLYTTNTSGGQCVWQEGGTFIPGTTNTFGGSSTTEYGPLSFITYPGATGPITRTNDFRNVLGSNPCNA